MENKQCAFYTDKGCVILTEQNCPDCSFEKTREQLNLERAKSIQRLIVLDRYDHSNNTVKACNMCEDKIMNQYASIDWRVFRKRLRELRESRGESRKDASELCGLYPKAFSDYESGRVRVSKIDSETVSRIADHFMVSIDYLLGKNSS